RSARRVVACLALLLFLGPHIEFDEIAVLTGFLLGCGFDLRPSRLSPGLTAAFMALLCAPIIFTAKSSQYGLYPWEKGPDGYFRWSGKNARVSLECAPDAKHRTVVFRALTPNMQADPVILEVGQPGSFQVLMMQEPGLYSATVSCGKALVVPARLNEANFDLTLSRIWTPSKQVEGGDQRLLGVQVVGE
ncbi:MAG: hypothetical protein GX589_10080, partial [Deltaproteobacteria bacterium]|nr:hypothetical protein [Deltaproteobacteria bacterium]